MGKSRSSIFSFKTLDLSQIPGSFWYCLILTLIGILAIEGLCRIAMRPLGNYTWAYWDSNAMLKFEWFRELAEQGNPPDLIAMGDSTGARDFDPESFNRTAENIDAYNLTWPANFPLALEATTFPLLKEAKDCPETIFLLQSPKAYKDLDEVIRFEESILSSALVRRYQENYSLIDYIDMTRVYRSIPLLRKYWLEGKPVITPPPHLGFMPTEGPGNLPEEGKDSSPRQPSRDDLLPFSPARRETLHSLCTIAQKRGIRLIVVLAPVYSNSLPETFLEHREWLNQKKKVWDFELWDYYQCDFLMREHFWDLYHLNPEGARLFSEELGRRINNSPS